MKNLINALTKMDKILVNETGIAGAGDNISFIFDDFRYNDNTGLVDKKIFKKSMDILDFKLDKINIDDKTIDFVNKKDKVTIKNENSSCYSPFIPTGAGEKIKISTDKLIECLSCTPSNSDNLSIAGVRIGKNGYTSTDTYRLYNIKESFKMDLTIPLQVVEFLKTYKAPAEIKIENLGSGSYKIKLDYGTLYFKAIVLQFPNAEGVIATANNRSEKFYKINKKEFEKILKKGVKIENPDSKYGAIFNFKHKEFDILVTSGTMCFETTSNLIAGEKDNLKISLNQKYLQSAIAKIKSDTFTISGSNSSSMVKIQGDDLTRVEVIMPLALRD